METRKLRKEKSGIVISTKMEKSIVVEVERKIKHTKYGKNVKKSSRFMAHEEKKECREGDKVLIAETRPFSKNKCWRLVEIIEKVK